MGVQCRPCGTPHEYRLHSKSSPKNSKAAETSLKNAPVNLQQNTRSGRTPAKTATTPLVPRATWPSSIPRPLRRKGKSVSPATSEMAISTPPTTKDVGDQAGPQRSQTLKRSSSALLHSQSDRPHKDTWGVNVPTVSSESTLHPAKENAVGSYKKPFYFPDNNDLQPCRVQYNSVSYSQEDGAWKWKWISEETQLEVLIRVRVRPKTRLVDHVIRWQVTAGYKMHCVLCKEAGPSDGGTGFCGFCAMQVVNIASGLTVSNLCLPPILSCKNFVLQVGYTVSRFLTHCVRSLALLHPFHHIFNNSLTRRVVLLWVSQICHAAAMSRWGVSYTVDHPGVSLTLWLRA
ncbi:hypothetical protein BJY52DRAFT_958138 [Lactarius psammicola]|nr:hypothetical protein BJY52DRAFT_958138 [Lactarius psammicola]